MNYDRVMFNDGMRDAVDGTVLHSKHYQGAWMRVRMFPCVVKQF